MPLDEMMTASRLVDLDLREVAADLAALAASDKNHAIHAITEVFLEYGDALYYSEPDASWIDSRREGDVLVHFDASPKSFKVTGFEFDPLHLITSRSGYFALTRNGFTHYFPLPKGSGPRAERPGARLRCATFEIILLEDVTEAEAQAEDPFFEAMFETKMRLIHEFLHADRLATMAALVPLVLNDTNNVDFGSPPATLERVMAACFAQAVATQRLAAYLAAAASAAATCMPRKGGATHDVRPMADGVGTAAHLCLLGAADHRLGEADGIFATAFDSDGGADGLTVAADGGPDAWHVLALPPVPPATG